METITKDEMEDALVRVDTYKMFILYVIATGLCKNANDFQKHFDKISLPEINFLIENGYLSGTSGEISLTVKGRYIVEPLIIGETHIETLPAYDKEENYRQGIEAVRWLHGETERGKSRLYNTWPSPVGMSFMGGVGSSLGSLIGTLIVPGVGTAIGLMLGHSASMLAHSAALSGRRAKFEKDLLGVIRDRSDSFIGDIDVPGNADEFDPESCEYLKSNASYILKHATLKLHDAERLAVLLQYVFRLSYEDIEARYGLSKKDIKTLLFKVLHSLSTQVPVIQPLSNQMPAIKKSSKKM